MEYKPAVSMDTLPPMCGSGDVRCNSLLSRWYTPRPPLGPPWALPDPQGGSYTPGMQRKRHPPFGARWRPWRVWIAPLAVRLLQLAQCGYLRKLVPMPLLGSSEAKWKSTFVVVSTPRCFCCPQGAVTVTVAYAAAAAWQWLPLLAERAHRQVVVLSWPHGRPISRRRL